MRTTQWVARATVSLATCTCISVAQSQSAARTEPSADTQTALQEVIVTASKRPEDSQRESRPIAVLGAEELDRAGVSSADALAAQVPGLRVAPEAGQLQVYIRGVGDRSLTSATDPGVALNIDGFYYPRAYTLAPMFFDLDRIEVLKGPQGTLYGRNATAGAINLISAKPQKTAGGYAELEYGNYNLKRVAAALTGPMTDTLEGRIAMQFADRTGYLSDGYDDQRNLAVRGSLMWRPTSVDSVLFGASYAYSDPRGDAGTWRGLVRNDPWIGPSDPRTLEALATQAISPLFATTPKSNGFDAVRTYTFTPQYEHQFDWATFTLMPSFIKSDLETLAYSSVYSPAYIKTDSTQKSVEARLSSPQGTSKWQWMLGAFGSEENIRDTTQANTVTANLANFRELTDKTGALFGEMRFAVVDNVRLIAGGRYTYEKKDVVGSSANIPFVFNPDGSITSFFPVTSLPAGAQDISGSVSDNAFNYRAGIEFDAAQASMLYANVASGFKAGGFNAEPAPNSFKPEKLTAFQAGAKNRFLDRRLEFNVEGFYWKYKDKQESYLGVNNTGALALITANAGQVTLYGVDISTAALVSASDLITGFVEYNHARYDRFETVQPQLFPAPPVTGCNYGALTVSAASPLPTRTIDCSGEPLVNAPAWSGSLAYQRTQSLGASGELIFDVEAHFSSSYFFVPDFIPGEVQSGYVTEDVNLTWVSRGSRVSVTAYVKNLSDRAIYNGGDSTALVPAVFASLNPPRTFGARFRVEF